MCASTSLPFGMVEHFFNLVGDDPSPTSGDYWMTSSNLNPSRSSYWTTLHCHSASSDDYRAACDDNGTSSYYFSISSDDYLTLFDDYGTSWDDYQTSSEDNETKFLDNETSWESPKTGQKGDKTRFFDNSGQKHLNPAPTRLLNACATKLIVRPTFWKSG